VAHMDTVEPAVPDEVATARPEAVPHRSRPVAYHRGQPALDVPVYRRESLGIGARFDGPAIVEERETTAVIRPDWSVEVAADGSLIATRRATTGGAR
jgi:N-methylhydantoinase A